jgi:hypothetical protein
VKNPSGKHRKKKEILSNPVIFYFWAPKIDSCQTGITNLAFKWAPTSAPLILYKEFYNLHLRWIWICISPYHVMTALISQALGRSYLVELWVTPNKGQTTA